MEILRCYMPNNRNDSFTVRFIVCYFPACSDMFWGMPENFMKIARKWKKKVRVFLTVWKKCDF